MNHSTNLCYFLMKKWKYKLEWHATIDSRGKTKVPLTGPLDVCILVIICKMPCNMSFHLRLDDHFK